MVSRAPDRAVPSASSGAALRITVAVVGVLFAAPLVYLAVRTATLGSDIPAVVGDQDTLRPLANTLLLAVSTSLACACIGAGFAWLVTRTDLRFARAWGVLAALPLVLPSFVGAAALREALGPGGLVRSILGWEIPRVEGFWGAWAAITLLSYPYVLLPTAARLRALPASLEESARVLGVGPWASFRRVVVPQAWDAVAAGALLVFLYSVSDFGAVSLMRYDTLTRVIYATRLADRATSLTLGLVLGVIAIGVAAGQQRVVRRRAAVAAGPSRAAARLRLGRWQAPAAGVLGAVVGLALIAPVAVFVYWWLRGSAGLGTSYASLGASLADLARPVLNTTLAGALAAVMALAVALPVAFSTARRRDPVGAFAATTMLGGFALPGLVVALAIVYWTLQTPAVAFAYQTLPLLILAYVLHFGAQAYGATQTAVAALPQRLGEAARTLGASPARRLLRIELPVMLPGLLAGGGLVLLSAMKELPATLLLAPIGFSTLATQIWSAAEDGFLAEVGVTSLALVALSGVLTWWLVLREASR